MKTFNVDLTIVDSTQVCADNVEEAEQIAWDIFKENGHDMFNAQLDTYEVSKGEL